MKLPVDEELYSRVVAIRRDLHQHPELSWQEERTSRRICHELDRLGIPWNNSIAGTGIVADIPGELATPMVALRADMDALPIQEETGLPFASIHPGRMHACAHDGHVSMVLGAAELLRREKSLPVTVRLIFQPAEERGAGAEAMVKGGALEDVGMIFGGHLDRHYQTGSIVVGDVMNASTDTFSILIRGQGGHAARPHESIDAVVVGSLLVMSLQTIVSREINPAHPSVITVGRFDAGTASNVIAESARLEGTIRAQDSGVRLSLSASIRRIADAVGRLHGAATEVEIYEGTPVLRNHPEGIKLARRAAGDVLGEEGVLDMQTANMGGEDFAVYLEQVPGCYVRFGAQVPGRESYPAHSSRFDFDEEALGIGAAYFRTIALQAGHWLRQR